MLVRLTYFHHVSTSKMCGNVSLMLHVQKEGSVCSLCCVCDVCDKDECNWDKHVKDVMRLDELSMLRDLPWLDKLVTRTLFLSYTTQVIVLRGMLLATGSMDLQTDLRQKLCSVSSQQYTNKAGLIEQSPLGKSSHV